MKLKHAILAISLFLPSLILAAPSDHGRPWDDPNYHSSGAGKLFMIIAIIAIIVYIFKWIVNNKGTVFNFLKTGFYILCIGIWVFIILIGGLDRCGRGSNNTSSVQNGSSTGYPAITYRRDTCRTCRGSGREYECVNGEITSSQCRNCGGQGITTKAVFN